MNAKLWIALHKQMHLIGRDVQLHDLCLMFLAHLSNDVLQSFCDALDEHFAPLCGTADHMRVAGRENAPAAPVCSADEIQSTGFGYLLSRACVPEISPCPHPKKKRAFYL